MKDGHYNHLHTINLVRKAGSIKKFIEENEIEDGIMSALVKNDVPFVLAGSIRDDGPLPEVVHSVYDSQDEMRKHNIPLWALESQDPVKNFDMIAFTIGYEMAYSNILNMLDLAGVPLHSKDRQGLENIVFAGGVCAFNPEPLADFVDFFALGEGEEITVEIAACDWNSKGYKGCILAIVLPDGTKIINTLNFND